MTLNTEPDAMFETHPYNSEPIPPETETLIVGTAPPPRFSRPRPPAKGPKRGWDADFYYGSSSNCLWVYLEGAAGESIFAKPGTADARKENTEGLMRDFLRRHGLWMQDILQTYRRRPGRETSASDNHIDLRAECTTFTKLGPILKKSKIQKIAFTSEKAAEWTFKSFEGQGLFGEFNFQNRLKEWKETKGILERYKTVFKEDDRKIFYILPTPSGGGWSTLSCLDKIEVYRSVLFSNLVQDSNSIRRT